MAGRCFLPCCSAPPRMHVSAQRSADETKRARITPRSINAFLIAPQAIRRHAKPGFLFFIDYARAALLHVESYCSVRDELHHAGRRRVRPTTTPNPAKIEPVTRRLRARCWSSGIRTAAETKRNVPAQNARPRASQAVVAVTNADPTAIPIGVSTAVASTNPRAVRRFCVAATATAAPAKLSGIW